MNTTKRLVSFFLCTVLLVTMLILPANATGVTDTASLSGHTITVNLYVDTMTFSAYTKFNGVADLIYVESDLWQKHKTTGAISLRSTLDDTKTGSQASVYLSIYGGNYAFYSAKSNHKVNAENQSWSCSLGRIYA